MKVRNMIVLAFGGLLLGIPILADLDQADSLSAFAHYRMQAVHKKGSMVRRLVLSLFMLLMKTFRKVCGRVEDYTLVYGRATWEAPGRHMCGHAQCPDACHMHVCGHVWACTTMPMRDICLVPRQSDGLLPLCAGVAPVPCARRDDRDASDCC